MRNSVKIFAIVFLAPWIISMSFADAGTRYLEINGPREFSVDSLNNMRIDTIGSDTMIHLPKTSKLLLVEEFMPKTDYFESEVRAYTYQQAFYWILATVILVYVRQHS